MRSRGPSRNQSRAASPALSVKSRKSVMSSRHISRNNFVQQEPTDDEDSGSDGYAEDFRSLRGRREGSARSTTASRRSRKNSTQSSIDLEDDSETFSNLNGNNNRPTRSTNRDRRSGSIARSIQSNRSTTQNQNVAHRTRENVPSDINDKFSTVNVSDYPMTPDSESEPGTKALVQAKIREKLAQQSSMDESSSDFWKPKSIKNNSTDIISSSPPPPTSKVQPFSQAIEQSTAPIADPEPLQFIDDTGLEELGPPPLAPDHEWECEFCTFVNEANTKICTICCKTPKNGPPKQVNNAEIPKPITVPATLNNDAQSDASTTLSKKDTSTNAADNNNAANKNSNNIKPASSSEDTNKDSSTSAGKIKGRTRKISFWPGTKSK